MTPNKRGFSCIGLYEPKTDADVGIVMRAAKILDVSMVVLDGPRGSALRHCADTTQAYRHIPSIVTDDLLASRPFDTQLVVVDLIEGATPLPDFVHPERAFYVFGPEDGTLGARFTQKAQHVIYIPKTPCMNLAATVNVVLYDRMAKRKDWE